MFLSHVLTLLRNFNSSRKQKKMTIKWERHSIKWDCSLVCSCQFQQQNPLGPLHILSFSFFIWSKAQKGTTYVHCTLFSYILLCYLMHSTRSINMFVQVRSMLVVQNLFQPTILHNTYTKVCWIDGFLTIFCIGFIKKYSKIGIKTMPNIKDDSDSLVFKKSTSQCCKYTIAALSTRMTSLHAFSS